MAVGAPSSIVQIDDGQSSRVTISLVGREYVSGVGEKRGSRTKCFDEDSRCVVWKLTKIPKIMAKFRDGTDCGVGKLDCPEFWMTCGVPGDREDDKEDSGVEAFKFELLVLYEPLAET